MCSVLDDKAKKIHFGKSFLFFKACVILPQEFFWSVIYHSLQSKRKKHDQIECQRIRILSLQQKVRRIVSVLESITISNCIPRTYVMYFEDFFFIYHQKKKRFNHLYINHCLQFLFEMKNISSWSNHQNKFSSEDLIFWPKKNSSFSQPHDSPFHFVLKQRITTNFAQNTELNAHDTMTENEFDTRHSASSWN